jgi:tetratricopeptide (TPR) repeat protein
MPAIRLLITIALLAVGAPLFTRGQSEVFTEGVGHSRFWQTTRRLIESGLLNQAQENLQNEVKARGENHETLYLEGLILSRQRRFREAVIKLQKCLDFETRDSEIHKQLALNAVALDRLDIAEPALKTTIELAPTDFMAHFHLGLLYFTTNRFALAESQFQNVTELRPAYMKGHEYLGLAREELEKDETAIQSYHKAVELSEQQGLKDESPYLRLAKFLWVRDRIEESVAPSRKAVELNPKSAEAHFVLGRLLHRLGQDEEALRSLQRSTEIDSRFAEAHYLASQIYLKQGREEEARKEMQNFRNVKHREPKQ